MHARVSLPSPPVFFSSFVLVEGFKKLFIKRKGENAWISKGRKETNQDRRGVGRGDAPPIERTWLTIVFPRDRAPPNLIGNYYFSNFLGDVVICYLQLILGEKLR